MEKVKQKEKFGSKIGFILTTAAFSVGIGNIWRFPYMVGSYGGGAFIFVFILLSILVGIPLWCLEMTLGRKADAEPLTGMWKLEGKKSVWSLIGWGPVSYHIISKMAYGVVTTSILGYFILTAKGTFVNMPEAEISGFFKVFTSSTVFLAIISTVRTVFIWAILRRGVQKGLERFCKLVMPFIFVSLIILAIRSLTLDGAMEGLIWYLKPDFSKININVIQAAIAQLFFSVGIGMGAGFLYGSYTNKKQSLVEGATYAILIDLFVAILAGLVIFPAIFAYGLEPAQGPGLVFNTMTYIFAKMPNGRLYGSLFFLMLELAFDSTVFGSFETCTKMLQAHFNNMTKNRALTIVVVIIWLLGIIPMVFGFAGNLYKYQIMGRDIFSFFDYIATNWCIMIGALVMALYVPLKWKWSNFKEDANIGVSETSVLRIRDWMKPLYYYVIPIFLVWLFLAKIGIL